MGNTREIDGFKFCYKICRTCGHAVRYFYPAIDSNDEAVSKYRASNRYAVAELLDVFEASVVGEASIPCAVWQAV